MRGRAELGEEGRLSGEPKSSCSRRLPAIPLFSERVRIALRPEVRGVKVPAMGFILSTSRPSGWRTEKDTVKLKITIYTRLVFWITCSSSCSSGPFSSSSRCARPPSSGTRPARALLPARYMADANLSTSSGRTGTRSRNTSTPTSPGTCLHRLYDRRASRRRRTGHPRARRRPRRRPLPRTRPRTRAFSEEEASSSGGPGLDP